MVSRSFKFTRFIFGSIQVHQNLQLHYNTFIHQVPLVKFVPLGFSALPQSAFYRLPYNDGSVIAKFSQPSHLPHVSGRLALLTHRITLPGIDTTVLPLTLTTSESDVRNQPKGRLNWSSHVYPRCQHARPVPPLLSSALLTPRSLPHSSTSMVSSCSIDGCHLCNISFLTQSLDEEVGDTLDEGDETVVKKFVWEKFVCALE